MKKSMSASTLSILLLSVAFLVMSVGFASYTQKLDLNGTVTAKKALWKVQFQDSSYVETAKSVAATNKTLTGTNMTYEVTLNPGEFYEFTVNVENAGTIAATLNNITLSTLTEAQAKYIKYTLTYNGQEYTATTSGLSLDLAAATNDVPTEVPVKVRVEYFFPENATDLPTTEDVTLNLTASLNYVQKAA